MVASSTNGTDTKKWSLDKDKIKILLLESIHESAVEAFNNNGYMNVESLKTAMDEDELIEKIKDVHILGIRSRTHITEAVLNAANKLITIGCFCIGTNQVDLDAAMEHGVPVFNAPYANTRSVAELVLAEIIILMRGAQVKNAEMHRGKWHKSTADSHEVRGKTLGIIGYGNIGSQLSVLAESLGMHVIFYDIITKLPLGNAQQVRLFDRLLADSDIVTLHVPETPQTKNMIGANEIAKMKEGVILINASRGTVVDLDALADSLTENHLKAASIDVYPTEPTSDEEEFVSPLRNFDNTFLTPHVGGNTVEAQANIGTEVAEKLIRFSDNGTTLSSVNFPEVSLPSFPDKHRILHIHHNIPGVLSAINSVFSESFINISSQYLRTNDKIGYVVTDIDTDYSDKALMKVKKAPGTIRTRILF